MKSFILYNDMCKNILALIDDVQAGQLFRMIVDYANGEELTSAKDMGVRVAFEIIRAGLDANTQAYEEMCEKRREYGRRGAEVTNSKRRQKPTDAENNGISRKETAKAADAEKERQKRLNIIKYNNNIIQNNIIKESNKEESNDSLSSCELDFARLLEFFNSQLKKNNSLIPSIKQLSDARKKTLKARAREYGKEALVKVFQKAAISDFLNGKNDRSFTASFDWLLKPTNFPKVLEGNYDNPVKDKPKDAITSNVNGLIEQVKQEQQQREDEKRKRILETYQAAKNGDARSVQIIAQMRENGTLEKYGLK